MLINYNEDRQFIADEGTNNKTKIKENELENDEENKILRSGIIVETIGTYYTVFTIKENLNNEFADPILLDLEYDYNFNTVKEIHVSDEFLSLDKEVTGCQNEEFFEDCKTNHYLETLKKDCGCLPLNIRMTNKVHK